MNKGQSSYRDVLHDGTLLNNGKYRIVRHLASGGFGNTYEAINTAFEKMCAIKEFFIIGVNHRDSDTFTVQVSNPAMTSTFESAKTKFKKEAQRLYDLHNDHIVRVHDQFEENNTVYYVMDYIDGQSLSQLMKEQGHPFSEVQVRDILSQMIDALRCIHAWQIWHMDIKPGNIMMDASGRCTLIDFGASKQTDRDSRGATSSAIAQTPGYAPMEQVNGNKDYWGPWTDIYALGATIYNLLTGNRPPLSDDISFRQSQAFSFPETVSQQMRSLVIHMMSLVFVNRPQNVDEVLAELNRAVTQPLAADDNSTVYGRHGKTESHPSDKTPTTPEIGADATVVGSQPPKPANGTPAPKKNKKLIYILSALVVAALAAFLYLAFSGGGGKTAKKGKGNPSATVSEVVTSADSVSSVGEESKTEEGKENTPIDTVPQSSSADSVFSVGEESKTEEGKENAPIDTIPQPSVSQPKTFNVKGVSFTMMPVEGGTLMMGATAEQGSYDWENDINPGPAHSVTLSSYYIGETEVTQALWKAVMGSNPSEFKGNNHPVENVSWDDCQIFIRKLNSLTGENFRLPKGSEWEDAARGGNKSRGYKYSGGNSLATVAWYSDNSGETTHNVKTRQSNELGIYDMSGNVNEWCNDNSEEYRGGGWNDGARNCRVANYYYYMVGDNHADLGLRLAL